MQLAGFWEALQESTLPFLVEARDWARLPKRFHGEIQRNYVVLVSAQGRCRDVTLGNCAVLVRDSVTPSAHPDLPYIGLEHIGQGTLSLNGVGSARDVESTKTAFRAGDILFGKLRPYFRKVIRSRFDGMCSTDIWVFRPRQDVDAGFLFYLLASSEFVRFASQGAQGTRMPRAKWEQASRFPVRLPPVSEQQIIAHVLGALDDKIELNRCMNETLEEIMLALFRSWFVDFDPVRSLKAPKEKQMVERATLLPRRFMASSLGRVPTGWKIGTLGDLCEKPEYGYTASAQDPFGSPKFLRITDINKAPWIDWASVPSCKIDGHILEKYRVREGDLLIARTADPGHGVFIDESRLAVFASYLIRFRPKNRMFGRYLQYWVRSDRYWSLVKERCAGTTRTNLNAKVLSKFPLIIPPAPIADAFAKHVSALRERVVYNATESARLAILRDSLLPKLKSGEIGIGAVKRAMEAVGMIGTSHLAVGRAAK